MVNIIQKWGNSCAVRIPKSDMESAGLREGDQVRFIVSNGKLTICKAVPHIPLAERAEGFQGSYDTEGLDESSVGKEVFW